MQDSNEREPYPKPCPKCNDETYIERSGKHIKWSCVSCGYIKFLPQKADTFTMPFGKYKGKTLNEIKMIDIKYLYWASLNMKDNIANRIKEVLK